VSGRAAPQPVAAMAEERPRFDGEDALPVPAGAAAAEGGETGAARTGNGRAGKQGRRCTPVKEWSKSGMLNTLRVLNLVNGLLLILADVLLFIVAAANVTFTSIVLSVFLVFFGLMLTCLECNIGNLAPRFRRNFGFLFSFVGRASFIIFCASLLFALGIWFGYLIGAVTGGEAAARGW